MYTLGEITQKVALLAQRSNDADYTTKIHDWVNLSHDTVFKSYDYWQELQSLFTFSSVASQEVYFLPSDFDKPFRLFDNTNNLKPTWITREEYYDANISNISSAQSGVPQNVMLYGAAAISVIPSSSFTLQAKSSSNSDNTGIIVRAEGWLDANKTILGYEDITINTGSPMTYATATVPTTFYGITRLTKSADTTGYITIANNSSAVLATIAPNDRQSRYVNLYLGLIPAGIYSYTLMYKRTIKKLVDDNDYPFMDCDDFLILNAYGYALTQEKETAERAEQIWGKAKEQLMLLVRNSQDKAGPDFQHKMVPATSQAHRH